MLVRTCPVKYGKGFSPACSPPCFLPPYRSVKWQGSLKVLGQNQGDISAAAALLLRLCFFFFSARKLEKTKICLLCTVKTEKSKTSKRPVVASEYAVFVSQPICISLQGLRPDLHHPVKHSQAALCVHGFARDSPPSPSPLTLECLNPAEHGGQRPHLHHLLPPVPGHAAGQAAQQRGGHPHPAVDLHQIISGRAGIGGRRRGSFIEWMDGGLTQ